MNSSWTSAARTQRSRRRSVFPWLGLPMVRLFLLAILTTSSACGVSLWLHEPKGNLCLHCCVVICQEEESPARIWRGEGNIVNSLSTQFALNLFCEHYCYLRFTFASICSFLSIYKIGIDSCCGCLLASVHVCVFIPRTPGRTPDRPGHMNRSYPSMHDFAVRHPRHDWHCSQNQMILYFHKSPCCQMPCYSTFPR